MLGNNTKQEFLKYCGLMTAIHTTNLEIWLKRQHPSTSSLRLLRLKGAVSVRAAVLTGLGSAIPFQV